MYVSSNTDYLKFKHADLEKKIRQTENLTPQKEINNLQFGHNVHDIDSILGIPR